LGKRHTGLGDLSIQKTLDEIWNVDSIQILVGDTRPLAR
jgi:hypothetical protein